jgi:Cu/Ag efflux protein CusF
MDKQDETKNMKESSGIKEAPEKPSDYGCGKYGWHKHKKFVILRIAILLLLILVVFFLGIALGSFKSANRFQSFGYLMTNKGHNYNMMGPGRNNEFGRKGMMPSLNINGQNSSQISGVISNIDGTKITIKDNGNQDKVILSTSNTRIISATGETNLSFLKTGQNISAVGTRQNNQLEASIIRVF